MIYTTYFANLKSLPADILPISICGKAPDAYKGLQYKKLAPKYDFFMKWKQTHDNEYYIRCFKEQVLNKLDIVDVMVDLAEIAYNYCGHEGDIALVCYERPEDFCHRHLVAQWLKDNGVQCDEFDNESRC